MGEYLQDLRQQEEVSDHQEAHLIDHFYNQLAREGYDGDVTAAAIGMAEEQLAPYMPNAESFGYETARKALRWRDWRAAFLADQEKRGDFDATAHWAEHEQAETRIGQRDHMYVVSFAKLSAIRLERERRAGRIRDPIRLERNLALTGLMNVLDLAVEDDEAVYMIDERYRRAVIGARAPIKTDVVRREGPRSTRYHLQLVPPEDEAVAVADNGEPLPVGTLTVVETTRSITADAHVVDPESAAVVQALESRFDVPDLRSPVHTLRLVGNLQPDSTPDAAIFERPTSPIPELAKAA